MIDREPDLLPELSPPAGGLARLRARREADQRTTDWWPVFTGRLSGKQYVPLLAGACTALLIVLVLPNKLPATTAADRLLGAHSEGQGLRLLDSTAAAQSLPSSQAGVRLYWTESLAVEQTAEAVSPPAI